MEIGTPTAPPLAAVMRTSVDTFDIQEMASRIMLDLGAGYPECVYQRALYNKIAKIDPSAAMEQTVQVVYESETIGICRADIVTAHHVIEVKAVYKMSPKVGNQIRKYMKHLFEKDEVPREGVIVNFNQDVERIDFHVFEPTAIGNSTAAVEYKRRKITPCD